MRIVICFIFCFAFVIANAQHTFSIVAIDTITGAVGSAGATCLTSEECGGCGGAVIISGLVAGKGAMNAQAQICIPNSNLNNGLVQIENGLDASEVLSAVLSNDLCTIGGTTDRQYGIVTLDEMGKVQVAGYTGKNNLDFANNIVGPNYAIQGNILLGPQVLSGMENGFLNTEGSLAEKLMGAMQGANIPGADSRCLADGISSRSSYLRVSALDNNSFNQIDLIVPNTINNVDPIDSLQSLFTERWSLIDDIEIIDERIALSIFPNPASDQVTVLHKQNIFNQGTIKFYNSQGVLMQENALANNTISIQSLPNGIVYYRVYSKGGSKVTFGKLIIHR